MNWFDIDRSGLAAIMERRGKAWALFELIQNAWDAEPNCVTVDLQPVDGVPFARITVTDDSAEGWADLDHAYTMFAKSRRAGDVEKRGRFNLGEKLVLSLARWAQISTMAGTITFDQNGRKRGKTRRKRGTQFQAELRMTRDELEQVTEEAMRLIPPVPTFINKIPIERPEPIATFQASLPTERMDGEGRMIRSMRKARVEAFEGLGSRILEMGLPVAEAECPWALNVHQKIPMNLERDGVTDAFRRAIQVAAVNAMADKLTEAEAAEPWASEALGDARIHQPAVESIVKKRFGERAVVASPSDPIANATAAASGCTIVHGGSLSGQAWANVKKHEVIPAASKAFPSPAVVDRSGEAERTCPTCNRPL